LLDDDEEYGYDKGVGVNKTDIEEESEDRGYPTKPGDY